MSCVVCGVFCFDLVCVGVFCCVVMYARSLRPGMIYVIFIVFSLFYMFEFDAFPF